MNNMEEEELIIKVTQEHIEKGKQKIANECPIAYALTELGFTDVVVGYQDAWGWDNINKTDFDLSLSPEMTSFIISFDEGEPVKPTTFVVSREKDLPTGFDLNLTDDEWRNS